MKNLIYCIFLFNLFNFTEGGTSFIVKLKKGNSALNLIDNSIVKSNSVKIKILTELDNVNLYQINFKLDLTSGESETFLSSLEKQDDIECAEKDTVYYIDNKEKLKIKKKKSVYCLLLLIKENVLRCIAQ